MRSQVAVLIWFVVLGQAYALDPIDNYCKLWGHQAALHGSHIYIDGGDMVFVDKNDGGDPVGSQFYGYNTDVLALDISRDWDWRSDTNFSHSIYTRYPKTTSSAANNIPVRRRGALFTSGVDESIYLYGGSVSPLNTSFPSTSIQGQTYSLWAFDTSHASWTEFSNDAVFGATSKLPNAGASADAPHLGLAFFINGQIDSGSSVDDATLGQDSYMIGGMEVIDFKTQTARNYSTPTISQGSPSTRGKAQYIANIGSHGALFRMGGMHQSMQNSSEYMTGSIVPLDTVDILDVSTVYNSSSSSSVGEWAEQVTTGDVPSPRTDFCLVSVSAADNSSHHIYLYGGRNQGNFYDDMFVLSLPAFHWTQVWQGNAPRAFHTCHLVAGSRMITIGGSQDTQFLVGCDWEDVGVGVYNLNTAVWGQYFNSTPEAYRVPAAIINVIGGGPNGGSNVTAPANGFSDGRVQRLFSEKASNSDDDDGSSSSDNNSSHGHTTYALAIGLGVGLGVSVLLCGFLLWMCSYRLCHPHGWYRRHVRRPARVHDPDNEKVWGISPRNRKKDSMDIPLHDAAAATGGSRGGTAAENDRNFI